MRFGILVVSGVKPGDRPSLRYGSGAGRHALMPFEATGEGGVLTEEHDIVVAADSGGPAPLDARVAHELAVLRYRPARGDRVSPGLVGDLEIVGGVSQHVEGADVAAVPKIPVGVLCSDRVVRMHVQVAEVRARRRKVVDDIQVAGRWPDRARAGLCDHLDL